jgi:hypothetical protein
VPILEKHKITHENLKLDFRELHGKTALLYYLSYFYLDINSLGFLQVISPDMIQIPSAPALITFSAFLGKIPPIA